MSRGPGRVMVALLETLEQDCSGISGELAARVGSSSESTRRALRKLRASGRVALLGVQADGARVWFVPSAARFLALLYRDRLRQP
ncbi:hypothetical protein F8S09_14170 [Deinococcus sp. SDU3-2]|uniref:ArsR family transcriptional regulator n=1 Tax=Deinococcus terrestris TaxID=2651870 RepID=A0A7X1NYS0_9DEIO|nr:hypothetical protein [Deinococcus terrestris]MPY67814.1 hypothetical protein [Deinococcus terrestris]